MAHQKSHWPKFIKKVTDQDSPRYVQIIGRQISPIGSIFWGFRCHILVISVIFMLNFCNSVTFCTFFHVKISKVHYLSLKFLVISKVPFLSLFSLKCCGTPDLGLWHTSVPWHAGWQPMIIKAVSNLICDFCYAKNGLFWKPQSLANFEPSILFESDEFAKYVLLHL